MGTEVLTAQPPFAVAVKAFIVHEGLLLLIRRRKADVHRPGQWDIPGERLAPDENPFAGLMREVMEETGLEISIVMPLDVAHFVRDDGQRILMVIFWCVPKGTQVRLSAEHEEFVWRRLDDKKKIPSWLDNAVSNFTLRVRPDAPVDEKK